MTLSIADLDNAKTDAGTIAAAATSTALTVVDRLGNTKLTLAGATARIAAINPRNAWAASTPYQPRDVVQSGGTWYIALDAHTAGSTFAGDQAAHWRVYQGLTSVDLATIYNLRSTLYVNDAPYNGDLKAALQAAAPYTTLVMGPGAYNITGLYKTTTGDGVWAGNTKAGIRLQGAGMARLAADGRSLVGGTVIQGTLFNLADNFEVYDLGVDVGADVVDNLYAGAYHEGFCPGINITYPTPATTIKGVKVNRVSSLAKPPVSGTSSSYMHSMLFENLEDCVIGHVEPAGGFHTFVSKVVGLHAHSITARGGDLGNGVIFKSDPANRCEQNEIGSLRLIGWDYMGTRKPAGRLCYEALDTTASHTTDNIKIGTCIIRETVGDSIVQDSNGISQNVSIGHLEVNTQTVACAVRLGIGSHDMRRFTIGTFNIVTGGRAFDLGPTSTDVHIGSGVVTVTGDSNAPLLTVNNPSQTHGRIAFIVNAAQTYASMIQRNGGQVNMDLIEFGGSAGILASRFLSSYPGVFTLNSTNFAVSGITGFSAPGAQYEPYKVTLKGAVKTILSAANPIIGTVGPAPLTKRRFMVPVETAGTLSTGFVDLLTNGQLQFIGTPALNSYVFLNGVTYDALIS